MLTQSHRSSTRLMALVAGLVIVALVGAGVRSAFDEDVPAGHAVLELGGAVYRFEATTCTITDADFLAAGSGEVDGDDFWVSVSSDGAELALGSSGPPIADDELVRLTSVGAIQWRHVDGAVEAELPMRDNRDARSAALDGRLTMSCSPTS